MALRRRHDRHNKSKLARRKSCWMMIVVLDVAAGFLASSAPSRAPPPRRRVSSADDADDAWEPGTYRVFPFAPPRGGRGNFTSLDPLHPDLPDVYPLAPADEALDGAYLVVPPDDDPPVLIGVPVRSKLRYAAVRDRCEASSPLAMMILTERCESSEAQQGWIRAFPDMRRVVHRLDAGRGTY